MEHSQCGYFFMFLLFGFLMDSPITEQEGQLNNRLSVGCGYSMFLYEKYPDACWNGLQSLCDPEWEIIEN